MNNKRSLSFYSPEEAQEYLRSRPDTVILDIRTRREYMEQRARGSIHLDYNEFSPGRVARLLPDKQRPVMVYCRAGLHSRTAVVVLRQWGYAAADIGSIHDWSGAFEGTLM